MITHEELLDLLDYDKETGVFRRKKSNSRSVKPWSVAGGKDKKGNGIIGIKYKTYQISRLAWFYVYREWPKGVIVHINDIKTDNRICNLKNISNSIHKPNIKLKAVNPHYDKRYKKWRSALMIYGNRINLGRFDTEQEAKDAITNYKLKLEESGIL